VAQERALEERFDAQVNWAEQREWLERMASEPNQVGSAHDRTNAEFMLEKLREWGWEAEIETFYVLYPKAGSGRPVRPPSVSRRPAGDFQRVQAGGWFRGR
jgi:hypothetical protein